MKMKTKRIHVLSLLFSLGWGSGAFADGLDCNPASTQIEAAICEDTALSELAAFADVLGEVTGLEVSYSEANDREDYGLSNGIQRLLSTLTVFEVEPLIKASEDLAWDFVFDDQNKILFIKAKYAHGQDALVVFDPSSSGGSTPLFSEMEFVFDAGRNRYRADGNILEVTWTGRPAENTEKFRYQDGCWRLIGEDTVWAGYMVEFNDDLAAQSMNYLTGHAIFDFKNEKGVVRRFDPQIRCLRQGPSFQEITFHEKD
jgi:hypothetical protein